MSGIIQALVGGKPLPKVTYAAVATDITALTNYTFSSVNIGTVTATRFVVVCCFGWSGSAATRTVSSVTIDGTPATALVNPATQYAGAIYGLNVASGITANIIVNFSALMSYAGIYVYTVDNLDSIVAVGTNNSFATATSRSFSLTTVPNGIIVAHAMGGPATLSITSWVGVTQDDASNISTAVIGAASNTLTTATATTVTVNAQASGALNLTAVALR